ncbi:MAG TPA: NAD(P)-dependent alcohol dehydrogenase [Methanocella sp.]|nr:NAD(P)-dependent alcohol dehydrogenase [Methanocella sp.]
MRSVVCTRYGPPEVLQVKEAAKPVPGDNEVLIKINAAVVTPADIAFRKGEPFPVRASLGLRKPKLTPGVEFAGEIETAGRDVKKYKKDDQVFGSGGTVFGAHAEYRCLQENDALAIKPANLDYGEAAAASYAGLTALPFLRDKAKIRDGQKVLINGASGSIGTFAVQLSKHFGAEVTGVCSTDNIDMVKSLGADAVIDYTREDFTKNGLTYDIIFDVVARSSYSRCKSSLRQNGIYLTTYPSPGALLQMLWTSKLSRKKSIFTATGLRPASEKAKDLLVIKELAESGRIRPVIDRRYLLEQIAEAHRHVEKGHKKGNVVLTIDHT